ncbi:hypothetical protein P0092_09290 [Ruminiclostridium papyrosolvens DSM 2782]|nr:hypothetical protein [Ruminiclostridium papyrosolvens]WES36042.1 hypothetical protein P0092_08790 [Ruminiclostridium papyrosolvens DSM 2782]WES36140.1 hypothetical protein P0092_09290 [Ruminiclostridium papyrosolvens DSM 2782]
MRVNDTAKIKTGPCAGIEGLVTGADFQLYRVTMRLSDGTYIETNWENVQQKSEDTDTGESLCRICGKPVSQCDRG